MSWANSAGHVATRATREGTGRGEKGTSKKTGQEASSPGIITIIIITAATIYSVFTYLGP